MNTFSNFHFKDLHSGEQILLVVHRNWFYLFQQFFMVIIISIFFIAGSFFLPLFFPDYLEGNSQSIILFMQSFIMLIIWIYGFMIWIDYYFDVWIITSERVINIEQKGLFNRGVSELMYAKIQDVSTEVMGFLPTIINYGDVKIQTASEDKEFLFRTVSDPYRIKDIIMNLQKQHEMKVEKEVSDIIGRIKQ
jgi:uncharacterized membrane protein YdbT with pleckstrin-like domain